MVQFSGQWLYLKGNDPIGDTSIFHENKHDYGKVGVILRNPLNDGFNVLIPIKKDWLV